MNIARIFINPLVLLLLGICAIAGYLIMGSISPDEVFRFSRWFTLGVGIVLVIAAIVLYVRGGQSPKRNH